MALNLSKFLHTKSGRYLMSVILGFGLATLFRAVCKGKNCMIKHAPPMDEIEGKTYKFDNKCSNCGWNEINIYTNNIPLEVEHIDGNSKNNKEENLTLLCPNCHSLTETYKGANRGNGRYNRRQRYKNDKSY